MAVLAGQVERRGALVGAGVDVGAVADQQGGQRRVAVKGGDVERREAVDVAAVDAEGPGLEDGQLRGHGEDGESDGDTVRDPDLVGRVKAQKHDDEVLLHVWSPTSQFDHTSF